MTGLDHTIDVIVEIATIVTDDELEIVAEGPDLVVHQADERARPHGSVRRRDAHPFGAARRDPGVDVDARGRRRARRSRSSASTPPSRRTVPLCGNSIGTDRRFLAAYLPTIEDHLHYRSIDVSSLKELVRRWYPKVRQARPQKVGQPPRPRRHPRLHRRAALLPRAGRSCPRTPTVGRRQPTRGSDDEGRRARRLRRATRCCELAEVDGAGARTRRPPRRRPPRRAEPRPTSLQRTGGYPDPRRRRATPRRRSPGMEYAGVVAAVGDRVIGWSRRRRRDGHRVRRLLRRAARHPRTAWPCPCRPASTSPTRPRSPRCSSRRGTRSSCRAA